jgi:hypothetical protein
MNTLAVMDAGMVGVFVLLDVWMLVYLLLRLRTHAAESQPFDDGHGPVDGVERRY